MSERLTLTAADGAALSAYAAVPPGGAPKGGLVVLQEIFGVNAHIRSVVDRFAAEGYATIAPALFDRAEPGVELAYDKPGIQRGLALMGAIDREAALRDIEAAVAWAATGGAVGVVGFCWGGTLAYAAATALPGLAAAVGYYGGGIAAIAADKLHCPVELHFGEADGSIPPADVATIRKAHPGMAVYTYPGAGHGFNCDARESYDAAAADAAWTRTLAFFDRHIG